MYRAAVVSLLFTASALGQHAVLVVAPQGGPGVDYTEIGNATAAADSGDTVLVRAGSYSGFGVSGKSVTVTADAGANVTVSGACLVEGLGANDFVTLVDLNLIGNVDEFHHTTLEISDCAGSVWLQGCDVNGTIAFPGTFFEATTAIEAVNAGSVVLSDCHVIGGHALSGKSAVVATDSTLHLYGSTCIGGPGTCNLVTVPTCGNGAVAVDLTGGLFTAQSSTVQGGASGTGMLDPVFGICMVTSASGPALKLGDGSPQVELYDSVVSAGIVQPPCGKPPAQVVIIGSGDVNEETGSPLSVTTSAVQRVGLAESLDFSGQPGDLVVALLALFPNDIWVSKWHGAWLVNGNFQILVLGVVPASGGLSLPYVVPPLPPGFDSVEFITQAARSSAEGTLLANPARVVLLAIGF